MKVAFYIVPESVDNYLYDLENKAIRSSILKKVNGVVFYIPYTPTTGMLVNLVRFNAIFKFNKAELDLLEHSGFFLVKDISMAPDHVELWLTFKDQY